MMAIMFAISYGVMLLMAKDQKTYDARPDMNIQAPTAEEGRPIAVLFGTKKIKGPNVVWYGDIKTQAIKK